MRVTRANAGTPACRRRDRVVDAHADADDEVRPLAIAEEELRRELGVGRDVLDDRRREGRRWSRRRATSAFAPARIASELSLGDEDVDVRVLRVREHDRRACPRPRARPPSTVTSRTSPGRSALAACAARAALLLRERGDAALDAGRARAISSGRAPRRRAERRSSRAARWALACARSASAWSGSALVKRPRAAGRAGARRSCAGAPRSPRRLRRRRSRPRRPRAALPRFSSARSARVASSSARRASRDATARLSSRLPRTWPSPTSCPR